MNRGASSVSTVATCDATRCKRQGNETAVSASRPNTETSVLMVNLTTYRDHVVVLQCFSTHHLTCTIRSVYYTQPSSCTFDVNANAMRVSGRCDIPKIYASDGKYLCRWIRHFDERHWRTLNGTFSLTAYVDPVSKQSYMGGMCSFTSSLFLMQGSSNFSMHTSPGLKIHVATITVDQASNITVTGSEIVNITRSQEGGLQTGVCQSNQVIDVEEGSQVGLVCIDTSTYITWYLFNRSFDQVANCNATNCTMTDRTFAYNGQMQATRPNQTTSMLYVDTSVCRGALTKFSCYVNYNHHICNVRLVYTSWSTECQFDINSNNATLTGSCVIPKIYSSDGKYKCQWVEQFGSQAEKELDGELTLTAFKDADNGRRYQRGSCRFSTPLFELNGAFTYRLKLEPGQQEYIAAVDIAVKGGASSITISGRGQVDTHVTRNATDIQVCQCNGIYSDVSIGARLALVCSTTAAIVRWQLQYAWRTEVASCNSTQCTVPSGSHTQHVLATRPNHTVSVLYVDTAPFQDQQLSIVCVSAGTNYCSLRTLYSTPPTKCQLDIHAANHTVSGSCRVEKLFSSQGGYTCDMRLQQQGMETKYAASLELKTFQDAELGRQMYRAVCTFTATIFFVLGTSNLSLNVFPGSTTTLATLHVHEDRNMSVTATEDVNITVFGTPEELKRLNCSGHQTFSVSMGSAVALICHASYTGISMPLITWERATSSNAYYWSTIARCSSAECNMQDKGYLVKRLNDSSSMLLFRLDTFDSSPAHFRCTAGSSFYYTTYKEQCAVRYFYASSPTSCSLTVDAVKFSVSGSCYFSKLFSSDGQYDCSWSRTFSNKIQNTLYAYFDKVQYRDAQSQVLFYRGSCSFSALFVPLANSSISYSIATVLQGSVPIATVHVDEHLNITVLKESEGINVTLIPGVRKGIREVQCGTDETPVNVPEDGLTKLVYHDTPGNVYLSYRYSSWMLGNGVSSCNFTNCTQSGDQKTLLMLRPNSSMVVLYVQLSQWRTTGVLFECIVSSWPKKSVMCNLRPVYEASPTNCTFDVSADTMMVSGSCDVDKVFSSDNVNCTWIERFENQTTKYINGSLHLTTFYDVESGYRSYQHGRCSFSSPLLLITGIFYFNIHISPGFPMLIATLYIDGPSNLTLVGTDAVYTSITGVPSEMNDQFLCQDGRTVDIPEYTQAGLICRDLSALPRGHMNWTVYRDAHPGAKIPASSNASCDLTSCRVPVSAPAMLAVRPNASVSVLYLSLLASRDYHQRVECWASQMQFCLIRIVYTSPPSSCQFDFNTTSYRVTASCDISKMFSSDGEYVCQWIQQFRTQMTMIPATGFTMTSFRDPVNKLPYKSGTCSVNFDLLLVTEELFSFSIRLSPGTTTHVATLEIGDHIRAPIKLRGAHNVNTTIDGVPTEKTATTISTTSTTMSTTTLAPTATTVLGTTSTGHNGSSTSSTHAVTEGGQAAHTWSYVAGGVGVGLAVILIAVIVVGVFVVRKLSGRGGKEEGEEGSEGENDEYFYTPRLKSDSVTTITTGVSFTGSSRSDHGSSFL